jgi:hypothetical protein
VRILINDFEETKEQYFKTFESFGYESNELIFCKSFESAKDFITNHLERKKLHIDLIITNDSKESDLDILKASELHFFKNHLTTSYSKRNFRISSIPTILYSKNETRSVKFHTSFSSIIQKNENGEHGYFIRECERVIRDWRKLLFTASQIHLYRFFY